MVRRKEEQVKYDVIKKIRIRKSKEREPRDTRGGRTSDLGSVVEELGCVLASDGRGELDNELIDTIAVNGGTSNVLALRHIQGEAQGNEGEGGCAEKAPNF